MHLPPSLLEACSVSREGRAWLVRLPSLIHEICAHWLVAVQTDRPFDATAAWVAPALAANGVPAVLKIPLPHMEGEDEAEGLRFWAGDPTVLLLESDPVTGAMLLEHCRPGLSLRSVPEPEQDPVIAALLKRLWRQAAPGRFRSLSRMVDYWCAETESAASDWPDPDLVVRGLRAFRELAVPSTEDVVLATDLHAGNVLSAQREPWLVIDPKPFVGDRAYDATQHLLNCRDRLRADPRGVITRFAQLLDVNAARLQRWLFARLAAEPRTIWNAEDLELARALEP